MEWFRDDGCLTDEGLRALTAGQLDELGRLETAEHLSYCDACMDRYTALLTADALETPPRSMRGTVMSTIWVRLMQKPMAGWPWPAWRRCWPCRCGKPGTWGGSPGWEVS